MTTTTRTTDPAGPPAQAEITAVSALPQQVMAAWSRHDAQAFADVFTEDGTMTLPGIHVEGRAAIAAFMADAFAGPYRGSQVVGAPTDLKVLAPGVVLLRTEGGVIPAGGSEVPAAATVRAAWVAVARDGEWKLAAYQNTPRD